MANCGVEAVVARQHLQGQMVCQVGPGIGNQVDDLGSPLSSAVPQGCLGYRQNVDLVRHDTVQSQAWFVSRTRRL